MSPLALVTSLVRVEHCVVLCVFVSVVALCRQTQKQPVEAAGEISSDGGEPAAQRLRGLYHRPGGDGGGVDSPAVRRPETALAMGARGQGRGRSLCLFLGHCMRFLALSNT